MLLKKIKEKVEYQVVMALEEDINEDEVEHAISHHFEDKCSSWDEIINNFF